MSWMQETRRLMSRSRVMPLRTSVRSLFLLFSLY